jgi:hypothetical protein
MKDSITIFEGAMSKRPPEKLDDFFQSALPTSGSLSDGAQHMLKAFEPFVEAINWDKVLKGPKEIRDRYKTSYQLGMAAMLANFGRTSYSVLRHEATLAGTDIEPFTRQVIRTIMRAYPDLVTPMLFPTIPMSGPTARILFENVRYDTAYASQSPNISVDDITNDLSKFHSGYFQQRAQLENLNLLKATVDHIDVSADTYGVAEIHSVQAAEDYSSQYGRELDVVMSERMGYHTMLAIDAIMIAAMVAAVPADHKVTWKRTPTINGIAWTAQTPSEQESWRAQIWRNAIAPAALTVYNSRYVQPNFMVCGSNASLDLSGVKTFVPVRTDTSNIDIRTGAIRDVGTLDNGAIRCLVAPMIGTNKMYLGYRPTMEMEPSLFYCPLRLWGMVQNLVDPRNLKITKGGYTRFAIGQPDANVDESDILGEVYAEITISDAA